ncbi:hypothetical protein [Dokdonia sp.]|uniref:hypothetical protein n=1 Tax=Dokdonia sp. TaxID=2024995 RepID=UPI003267FA69
MKTFKKTNVLSLEKFQIAKLNNINSIRGGAANNANNVNNTEEEGESEDTITITTTWQVNPIGG